jgi:protein-disulfide isomerase
MFRRFVVTACRRAFLLCLAICLGCSAQAPTELAQKIERQLRVSYNVPPTVRVLISTPHNSEFQNYDAITVTFDGDGKKQNYDFLISKDQKTLIRMTRMDLSKDPYAENMKKIDTKGRPVRGNPNAKVVVVSYDDFQCPYCSSMHKTLFPQILKEYGDRVAFIYKDFPLAEIHPWAIHAAVDANCLASQNNDAYWDFADYVHNNRDTINSEKGHDNQFAALDKITQTEAEKFKLDSGKLQSCVKAQNEDAVRASMKEGDSLGVTGTPTMFVNGQMVDGARSVVEIHSFFDNALQQAGVGPAKGATTSASGPAPATPQPSNAGDHASSPH